MEINECVSAKLYLLRPAGRGGGLMSTDAIVSERTCLRSQADGGIVAEVRLDHADLALRPTLGRVSDVSVEPEYWTTVRPGRTLAYLAVSGDRFDEFESALELDPTVRDPVLVDRYPDRHVYRVELTERAIRFTPAIADVGGRVLDISSSRDGWLVQLRLPDRDALVALNEACGELDVSFSVNHLRTSDDGEDGVVGLTAKQQDLLTVAYEEGYFDVPRGISQDELADRLGVSKSAISQRLRRAIAELCRSTLSVTDDADQPH